MNTKSFLIDVDKCTDCKLCIIACKDEHVDNSYMPWTQPQPTTGHFWIDVHSQERGQAPRLKVSHVPLLCQHCENAPCVKACPEGAIKTRDDGLVWINPATCTGCGLCKDACPYDVIYMNDDLNLAQKCTGCAPRVDAGQLPRCAEVCPHDAIVFGDAADVGTHEIYHPEYLTKPRVTYKGLPKPWIAGIVIDEDSDDVIAGVNVTAIDLFETGSVSVQTDAFGDFWVRGMEKDRKYKVEISKAGYTSVVRIVTTNGDQDLGTVCLKAAT